MKHIALAVLLGTSIFNATYSYAGRSDSTQILIKRTDDFQVSGTGDYAGWSQADWVLLTIQESAGRTLGTKIKVLYSETGLYFLFQSDDQKLTASIQEDFASLWREDVVEVFLWPDPAVPIYFEYELSPLNYELPILVPNVNGKTQGWKPWNYRGKNKTHTPQAYKGAKKQVTQPLRAGPPSFLYRMR